MKYKIGDLLEARFSYIINTNNFDNSLADYGEEEVKAGQLFLVLNYGQRSIYNVSDIGYTLYCQESGTSSFWGELDDGHDSIDTIMEYNFKKVL